MRILLAIVHYFRGEAGGAYASTQAHRRDARAAALREAIDSWRGHLGDASLVNHVARRFERVPAADSLDIVVVVNGADHLLDAAHCRARDVARHDARIENPRMLGFAAQRVLAEARGRYDLLVYSEDDLRICDATLPAKVATFQAAFGPRRVALPNRYEWNPAGPTLKTYLDGDLRPERMQPFFDALPDQPRLTLAYPGASLAFERARNPHAGFFALTAEQMQHWVGRPHFGDLDDSFISPLESAATLGLLKTFAVYKPAPPSAGWMEIEHLDQRLSGLPLPRA
jgi:hypothetical protein